jgi:hypothetical protein
VSVLNFISGSASKKMTKTIAFRFLIGKTGSASNDIRCFLNKGQLFLRNNFIEMNE